MTSTEITPPVLRQMSVRAVMDVLLHRGATSRADLAKLTGLSKQTMSEVIRALEEGGWVEMQGVTTGRVGRAPVTYKASPEAGYVIGADLGATTCRIAVANILGEIVDRIEEPSASRGGLPLIAQLVDLKQRLLAHAKIDPAKILTAAVATPGVVDPDTGELSLAPNIADIAHVNVVGELRARLAEKVIVENDINAAVIGESWRGCAVGVDEVAFVSLGTGIGLGALVEGRLLRGASGAAGEISYLPIGAEPTAAASLERGALECAIGAQGIRERYTRLGGDGGASVRAILDAAASAEVVALETARQTAAIAAQLVVAVASMLDPRKVIIGGNIGRHPLMAELIRAELPSCTRRPIAVETSALGQQATLEGAVAIALNDALNSLFSPRFLPERMRIPRADAKIGKEASWPASP